MSQKGMTLLEIILVLAVSASIMVFGLRMYQQYKLDSDFRTLEANVDTLFQSLGEFYRAECASGRRLYPTGTPPLPSVTQPFPININSDLVTPGYLSDLWPMATSIVNRNDPRAYIAQLNPSVTTTTATPPVTILIWLPQVAVKLRNPARAQAFAIRLGADCVSDLATANTVTPCPNPSGSTYLVWQRSPSVASPSTTSSLWVLMPLVKQFELQYTNLQNPTATYQACGG